jgi:signal transduction histidine kinase
VIYLTAHADDETLERAKVTEPLGYILKPFTVKDLHSTIEMALYKHKAEEALRKAHDSLEQRVQERTVELERANAALIAEIAERKRTEKALQRRNDELIAINSIATILSQSFDLDHRLKATLDKTLEVAEMDEGWIQLSGGRTGGAPLLVHCRLSPKVPEEMGISKLREQLTGKVIQLSEPVILNPALSQNDLRTFTGVPIKSKNKVIGVLGVFGCTSRHLNSSDVQLLTAVAHQVGLAIENTQLAKKAANVKLLQELDRLRSELIDNISHELRTPLGLIKVSCSSLAMEDVNFDEETRGQFLRHIDEEADKLEAIVGNLLSLSQAESGRLRLARRSIDIGQLIRDVIETMQMDSQIAQHRFVLDLPSDPLMAMVDVKGIEQVLRNLLNNAIKYSPEEGTITVHSASDKEQLLIKVSDEGIGIPPQYLERIFERFYRVDNEITKRVGGVGLGLAVCRGIVQSHGGHIWAESEPDIGSSFYFMLPCES